MADAPTDQADRPDEPGGPESSHLSAAISEINPAASVVDRHQPVPAAFAPIASLDEPAQTPAPAAVAAEPEPEVLAPAAEVVVRTRGGVPLADIESHISEFAADVAGSLSPFGDDVEFPLPIERLGYRHPVPANRPALAGA